MRVFAIRAELGLVPVIFITGSPERCAPCDYAVAILRKPIDAPIVIAAFRDVADHVRQW